MAKPEVEVDERFIEVSIGEPSLKSTLSSLEIPKIPWYRCQRHLIPVLCFFAVFVMYIVRFSFSQASIPMSVVYGWSQFKLSLIVSAFYMGYLPSQVIGASASKAWGGKPVVAAGLLLSCLGSVFIPLLANFFSIVLALRVVMGIGQGVMYPAMTELLSQWVIPQEKSFWLNFSWSGAQAGTIFCLGIYPILNEWFGWKFPFFAFGAVGIIWMYLWTIRIFESPKLHPSLSTQEKMVFQKFPPRRETLSSDARVIPWMSLFFSWEIYPLTFIYFGYNWPFYLMINSLPTFLETVLGFKASTQGLMSMVPYVFLWISLVFSGLVSDWLIKARGISVPVQRKGMVFLGFIPSALILIFLSKFSHSVLLTLVAINIAIALPGISMSGFSPVPFDLSPEYAGAITSVCSVFGSTAGILCPVITGLILDNAGCNNDATGYASAACKQAWFNAFQIGGAVYILVTIVWVLFASFKPISFDKINTRNACRRN